METCRFAPTVTIARLALSGDGVSVDGRRVPCTLPGERVRLAASASGFEPAEILAPSPERREPPCPHFGACGGCLMQHASDGLLAEWKTGIVTRALAACGLPCPVRAVHVSPPGARRRATFAGRRTRKGTLVGFRQRRGEDIVPLAACHVVRPALLAALPALHAITARGASRAGIVRLAVTASDAGIDLDVAGGKPLDAALRESLAGLAEVFDLARLTWEREPVAARRPPVVQLGTATAVPPPAGFLQATREGEVALGAAVAEAVAGAGRIADLFAGAGTFALPLAASAEVHAVEADDASLTALDAAWRAAPGLKRVTTEARDLHRRPLSPAELDRFDAAVIDPPRAGCEAQARALAGSKLARVAAVSCNPVSFARDVALLVAGGYGLDWVEVIDQFRWSSHVEIAAGLSR